MLPEGDASVPLGPRLSGAGVTLPGRFGASENTANIGCIADLLLGIAAEDILRNAVVFERTPNGVKSMASAANQTPSGGPLMPRSSNEPDERLRSRAAR
jgi:hypothetical protein